MFERSHVSGIAMIITAKAAFAVMTVFVRALGPHLPVEQIVFFRNIFALFWMLPYLFLYGMRAAWPAKPWGMLWRSLVGIAAMETWFYSLVALPLNIANALGLTSPLFSTVLAALFLKEHLKFARLLALLIGFAGAMIVIAPWDSIKLDWQMRDGWMALLSAALVAWGAILVKTLTTSEPAWRIVFFTTALMTLFSFPSAAMHWVTPTPLQWLFGAAAALAAVAGQLCTVGAFARAPVNLIMPFNFTGLLFTLFLAWLFFGETASPLTLLGACIILTTSLYVARAESSSYKRR